MQKAKDKGRRKGPCGLPQAGTLLLFQYVLQTLSIWVMPKYKL